MIKIKSAHIPDFTDVNVRRMFGYVMDRLQTLQDQENIAKLNEIQQELALTNPHISLEELKQNVELWSYLHSILDANWTENPNRGI